MRMIGIAVLAVGILALVYGGFSYTRETHDVKLGPVEFSVKEKERVNVPLWAGVGACRRGRRAAHRRAEEVGASARILRTMANPPTDAGAAGRAGGPPKGPKDGAPSGHVGALNRGGWCSSCSWPPTTW